MGLTINEIESHLADALEHLHDHAYLGEHPLSHLRVVDALLVHDQTPLTFVDRGRALSRALHIAIAEMKPDDETDGMGHDARLYYILANAYGQGLENSQVARDLAISERTFYRERRLAVHALAHVLCDMESEH